ncbi:MAG: hypothetical protein GY922_19155 [Proteobacteria bacterium]|nr:hypothetical protein [Pseudomonadota bacterium]
MPTPYRRNARTPAGRISATPSTANWGGLRGLLSQYPGAAGAYSLRKIGSGPVVQLRRASDSVEKDFTAAELVGSFTGSQKMLNPEFDSATGWSLSGGWTITGGQAVNSGTSGNCQQGGKLTVGNYYIATIEIVACSSFDDCKIRLGASSSYSLSSCGINTTGTHKVAFQAQSTFFLLQARNSATMTVEFMGAEDYTPTAAEQWVIESEGNTTNLFAFVRYWYDQSGSGNHAGQSTLDAQPKLITAGVTETENGKPAIVFDGSQDVFTVATDISSSETAHSIFAISDITYDTGSYFIRKTSGTNPQNIVSGMNRLYNDGSSWRGAGGELGLGSQNLATFIILGSNNNSGYSNGTVVESSVSGSQIVLDGSDRSIGIGGAASGSNLITGSLQELIVYDSDQSANRVGIETNINDHYGIY